MFIIIPGAFNAQVGVPGGGQQGQVVTVGSILKVTERDRRPYPTDVGTPSEIWIDNTAGIGYICKEFDTGHGTVWDRLDLLGDFVSFGDSDPGVIQDIKMGYRPGSLRYARNSEILWICKDNTQGAAVWDVLSSGGSVVSVNGLTGVVQLYLDDILDVDAPLPTDGDVLTWDSATSTWIAATGVGTTYTANNGLTAAPGNIFQLGGTLSGTGNLIRDTYITNDNYIFRIDQTGTAKSALYLSHLGTGVNYGVGLTVQVADGRSIRASSTGNVVFEGVSQADYTAELTRSTATTTGIEGILKLVRGSSGVPAPDIGGSIDFWIKARTTTPFPGLNTAAPTEPTVRLVGLWENPGYAIMSRLSRFDIYGFKNNTTIKNASVTGTGKFTLYQYGQTPATFLDTPVWSLGVNAAGDVIEFDGATGGLEYAIASGTNAYVVTIAGVTAYTDGDIYSIKFTNSNTTTSTIDINGLGPQHLHKSVSTSLASGDIISGQVLIIQYDGTNFQVIGIAGGTGNLPAGGTAGQILTKIDATNYNTQWANNVSSVQHIQQYVKNNQGVPVSKGQAVYINGADGTNATIKLAQADTELTSSKTLGLLEQDLNNNAKGYVITEGLLSGLDTSAANADGDPVWLSPTTPGGLVYGIANKPSAPSHLVFIGIVIRKNVSNGEIYVKVQNGFELKELHDVQAQSPANNDTLYYDNVTTPLKPQWKTAQASTLLPTSYGTGSFGITVDGVSTIVQVGKLGYVTIPYAGTITGWSITANAAGNIQFDIWSAVGAIPTIGSSIITTGYPLLSADDFDTSTLVSGWDTAFVAGTVFGFHVIGTPSVIKNATLTIRCTKT